MTRSQALEVAREMIDDPAGWCQGHLSEGQNAERVCALGAFRKAGMLHPDRESRMALEAAEASLQNLVHSRSDWFWESGKGANPVARFNDTHTHAEVIALFQEAIRKSKHAEAAASKWGTPIVCGNESCSKPSIGPIKHPPIPVLA